MNPEAVGAQDGRTVTASVLVGADGNLSDVRRQLLADGLPRFAGLAVWRAVRCAALVSKMSGIPGRQGWACRAPPAWLCGATYDARP